MLFRSIIKKNFLAKSTPLRSFSAGGGYGIHRDTDINNDETPFEFTDESYVEIKRILGKYPTNYKQSAVIPLLMLAQKQNGNNLTLSAMNKIAKILEVPPVKIYQVTSFYSMFNSSVGKYHIQVCGTTPCLISGSRKIMKAIEEHIGAGHG